MIFQTKYKKPVLLVGSGVRMAGAVEEVHAFVKKTNIPLLFLSNYSVIKAPIAISSRGLLFFWRCN